MTRPRQPKDETLGEFVQYQELLTEAGKELIAAEDTLLTTEARQAARDARRRGNAMSADQVGRGRSSS